MNHSTNLENNQTNHDSNLSNNDNKSDEQSQTRVQPSSQLQAQMQAAAVVQLEPEDIPPPKPDFLAPPPYEVVTKLPSYEEVQREKTLHGEPIPQTNSEIRTDCLVSHLIKTFFFVF